MSWLEISYSGLSTRTGALDLTIHQKNKEVEKMKVVILAGGFSTKISEESYLRPKPVIEIGGQPILWHIMKLYSYYGFNDFVICRL